MAAKTKKAFVQYPSTCGFVVKDCLKNCSRKGAASLRNRHCFDLVNLGTGRSLTVVQGFKVDFIREIG